MAWSRNEAAAGGATHNLDEECEKVCFEKQKVSRLSLGFFKIDA